MCEFKSMILLKDRVYCPAETDRHLKMVEDLGIRDDKPVPCFVKIEIRPPNGDTFAPVEQWNYLVNQDILPEWYIEEHDKPRAFEALAKYAAERILMGKVSAVLEGEGNFYVKDCKNLMVKGTSNVKAYDTSNVKAYGTSNVEAYGTSNVKAYGTSNVEAYGTSNVKAYGTSNVEAYGTSNVEAYGTSNVKAYDTSNVKAYGTSNVEAYDTSNVKAYGTSNVKAYDTSNVEAYDTSNVKAYDTSNVKAYGTSTIVAPYGVGANKERIVLSHNSTFKDCKTKTIYQSGDWKLELVESATLTIEVGDIVEGTSRKYSTTNIDMTRAEVVYKAGSYITIKILEHSNKNAIGETFEVDEQYFAVVEKAKKEVSHEN